MNHASLKKETPIFLEKQTLKDGVRKKAAYVDEPKVGADATAQEVISFVNGMGCCMVVQNGWFTICIKCPAIDKINWRQMISSVHTCPLAEILVN